jgi:prolyl oligopeptidase
VTDTTTRWTYPDARRDPIVEDYHGTPVADPYRWLEDQESTDTAAWVAAQRELTQRFLEALPDRAALHQRLTQLWDYPRTSLPWRRGGQFFFFQNSGLQNQAALYRQETLGGPAILVLDPNSLSEDGTVALTSYAVSQDGQLLAYGASRNGSDWQELRVRRVATGEDFDEVLHWCRFTSIAWRHDNAGFYYSRFPEPGSVPPEDQNNFHRVYWHRVGTPQEADLLIYERPDAKELAFSPTVSEDGRFLVLDVWQGTNAQNRCYYRPVESDGPFVRLLDDADALYHFLGNVGDTFYFQTNLGAPQGRVVAIDLARPGRADWREVLPEQEAVLDTCALINHRLVAVLMRDVCHEVQLYHLDGSFDRPIGLPGLGTVTGLSGQQNEEPLLIGFESFLYPPGSFRYDSAAGRLAPLHASGVAFDADAFETHRVFVSSKDGTRVPVFLTHRRGLALDGGNPTLLYGYGGFNVGVRPSFSPSRLAWIERGGVYAVACLRGGSEYGETWHEAGMLERKQNVFDDCIAVSEWLIAAGYTSARRLAIMGGSNGGLLVAACMTQRPELYSAVICAVPVIDMLRYHRFTIGRFWTGEYGNAEENPEHFRFLLAYSPLHNLRPGATYPATLITTAESDDRVVPAHARKFAAALQAADSGANPILLRVERKAGHGLGKPTSKLIDESADIYAFLLKVMA